VRLVSLETLEEMPADTVEIREGDEEGVERLGGFGPIAIERDGQGRVRGLKVKRCLRVYDAGRRFAPVFDEGDLQLLECDTVLLATGQATDLSFLASGGEDVVQFRPGWPKVDPETLATTAPGVFAAGDLAHGTRILIDAVASGKKAARSVFAHVTGRKLGVEVLTSHFALDPYHRELGYESLRRKHVPVLSPEERLVDPKRLVEVGYDEAEARREASRCLDCGVTPVFDGGRCVLCGGCADVCPTLCLKLTALGDLEPSAELDRAVEATLGQDADRGEHSAILKDEDRCIRCGLCAMRCPVDAITMERTSFAANWRPS
jgi:ferredoxin